MFWTWILPESRDSMITATHCPYCALQCGMNLVECDGEDCSPCLKRECPIDHRCMTRVEASRVANAALDIL